jgi:hypothetical protein
MWLSSKSVPISRFSIGSLGTEQADGDDDDKKIEENDKPISQKNRSVAPKRSPSHSYRFLVSHGALGAFLSLGFLATEL